MRPDWRTSLAALPWVFVLAGLVGLLCALVYRPRFDDEA